MLTRDLFAVTNLLVLLFQECLSCRPYFKRLRLLFFFSDDASKIAGTRRVDS